jgi:hypothetical protein
MPRKKERDWKKVNFSIDPIANEKLTELSKFEGVNKSEFIEILIHQWDSGVNPEIGLNNLLNKRKAIMAEVNQLDIKIKEVSDQLVIFNEWKHQKSKKKEDAVKVLERILLKNDFDEAQRISKFWQSKTGIPAFELLVEAKTNIDKRGV